MHYTHSYQSIQRRILEYCKSNQLLFFFRPSLNGNPVRVPKLIQFHLISNGRALRAAAPEPVLHSPTNAPSAMTDGSRQEESSTRYHRLRAPVKPTAPIASTSSSAPTAFRLPDFYGLIIAETEGRCESGRRGKRWNKKSGRLRP